MLTVPGGTGAATAFSPKLVANPSRSEMVETEDGLRLAVEEWGDPDGPEILFIHGLAQSRHCFAHQTGGELARRHRIVAFDLRGHGDSDAPDDPAAYADPRRWGEDIMSVIQALELRRPVLVGWSLGARVIVHHLAVRGDRHLAGIVVAGSRMFADPAFDGPAGLAVQRAEVTDLASRIRAVAGFLRGCYHRQPDPDTFAFQLGYNLAVRDSVRKAIRRSALPAETFDAALRSATVPALVVHGLQDRVVVTAAAEKTAAMLPNARLLLYEDCGHAPFFEQPARFNDDLAAFIGEAAGGGGRAETRTG
jgi:pimeloyl-ACP methyl ester carboxylesterase